MMRYEICMLFFDDCTCIDQAAVGYVVIKVVSIVFDRD